MSRLPSQPSGGIRSVVTASVAVLRGGGRRTVGLAGACVVVLFAVLSLALPAGAAAAIALSPEFPTSDEQVTATADTTECPNPQTPTYVYSVDGVEAQSSTTQTTLTRTYAAGSRTVDFEERCSGGGAPVARSTRTFSVADALRGTISTDPDPPVTGRATQLSATQTGGYPGYAYAWDIDNDGAFDDSTSRTPEQTYTTTGARTVRVRITDRDGLAGNQHTTVATRTFTVGTPPAPVPGAPPAPEPAPCEKRLAFELSEFHTKGCFRQVRTSPSPQWETTSEVELNGIRIPDFGQRFVITEPTKDEPGGHFTAPNSSLRLGGLTTFSGDIDWSLPAADQDSGAEEQDFRRISVTAGAQLFGLGVKGTIELKLGRRADGSFYALFPLTIEMPPSLSVGPDTSARATGSSTLLTDHKDGPRFGGLRLEASDVWIGKLSVKQVCFSYAPAGSSASTCTPPAFPGAPASSDGTYLTCNQDTTVDRWAGSASVQLPSRNPNPPTLSAFGGLAGGRVASLGGSVSGLGKAAPIGPGVYLDSVGFGLCLRPPPLKIRGDIGIGILPTAAGTVATINGYVLYTDSDYPRPWQLEAGGAVQVYGKQIGEGSVTLRPYGQTDFRVASKIDLTVASIEGEVKGWVDPPRDLFSVQGSITGRINGLAEARGSAIVSSVGVAGCVTAYSTGTDYGTLVISLETGKVSFARREFRITAGAGYKWNGATELFGDSCSFGAYEPVRPEAESRAQASSRALGGGTDSAHTIRRGQQAVSFRVSGTDGPPKLVLRGPDGETISSPAGARRGAERRGRWMLAENRTNGTTNVVLLQPAPGEWRISALPGGDSAPTSVERAELEAPPSFAGRVRSTGETRTLDVAYAVPEGTTVRLFERAPGIGRAIAAPLRGGPCPNTRRTRPGTDQRVLCARVRFRPSQGPGGTRRIQAVVTRGDIPVSQKNIASFRAPAERLPARMGMLRARRVDGDLVVVFPGVRGAARYSVIATLSDGRRIGVGVHRSCRAVRIPDVPADVSARVTASGVRYDLEAGRTRALELRAGVPFAGRRGKLPRRPCEGL